MVLPLEDKKYKDLYDDCNEFIDDHIMQLNDSSQWCVHLDDKNQINDKYSLGITAKEACFKCAHIGNFL